MSPEGFLIVQNVTQNNIFCYTVFPEKVHFLLNLLSSLVKYAGLQFSLVYHFCRVSCLSESCVRSPTSMCPFRRLPAWIAEETICRDPPHYYCFKYSFVNNLMGPRRRKKSMLNYLPECIFTKCQGERNDGQEQTSCFYYEPVSVEFNVIFSRLSIYACILYLST